MIIRKAEQTDLLSIAKVQVESNRSTYQGIMPQDYLNHLSYNSKAEEWKQRLFTYRNECIYVAEKDSNIVGYASFSLQRTNDMYEKEITSFYILKENQRQGIGKALFKAIIEKFNSENVKSIFLWTLKDNPSRVFYEHLGGKIVDKRTIFRGGSKLQQVAYAWEDISLLNNAINLQGDYDGI